MQILIYGGILPAFNNLRCWLLYRSRRMTFCIFKSLFNRNLEHTFGVKKEFVRKEDAPFL